MELGGSELHPVFHRDPSEMMQYVYKQVVVTCADNKQYSGWVFTVDPVTGDMVLKHFEESNNDVTLVMGHCIDSVTVTNDCTDTHKCTLDSLFKPEEGVDLSPVEINTRFKKLKIWLERNLIPVTVTGDSADVLCIADAVYIDPPYFASSCSSTNEIILGKVQGLVQNLPSNIDDW